MLKINLAQHPALTDHRLVKLLECLNIDGQARIVGGCVRDALLGRIITDVDIATTLPPQEVKRRLPSIGGSAASRREDHGSVLVILEGQTFDVTTLRQDVQTTGRHAQVSYTSDWGKDAQRRDFTVNALYCDLKGQLYDPLGCGVCDLNTKRLVFIGELEQRVQEDYLRVLRYFRFLAQLEWPEDPRAIYRLAPFVPKLKTLSTQRLYDEFFKILGASNPLPVLQRMDEIGIFQVLFEQGALLDNFAHVLQRAPDLPFLGRLLAICPAASCLLLRKKDKIQAQVVTQQVQLESLSYPHLIYFYGAEVAKIVASLRDQLSQFQQELSLMKEYPFPVKAKDIPLEGPELRNALKKIEHWWIARHCIPDRKSCLEYFFSGRV